MLDASPAELIAMRIISGTARGRRLVSPGGKGRKGEIRPTSDRAREAIFNVLAREVDGARVLDLFAGTGALGLEALSRGARSALFVDKGQTSIDLVSKNIELCGFWPESTVVRRDLTRSLFFLKNHMPKGGFSLVFVDPPYLKCSLRRLLDDLAQDDIVASGGMLVVESSSTDTLPETASCFVLVDRRSYGEAGFWLYRKQESEL
ncbi:MAG: 16S rRNA (guanine(966)-N(2))-methyltransferase RsmD [Desulfobulbaceae bacterium]|nr:16S rRNA (guanine(966)-N(2))-methyltransferase RsmD [Desulfobulbaceae bacterium]